MMIIHLNHYRGFTVIVTKRFVMIHVTKQLMLIGFFFFENVLQIDEVLK